MGGKRLTHRVFSENHRGRIFYISGLLLGMMPMLVGLAIVLVCWAAREAYAVNLSELELFNILWVLIAPVIGFLSLVLHMIFVFVNRTETWKHFVVGVLLLLTNIPVINWVNHRHAEVHQRAYIRIKNFSGIELTDLTLSASTFRKKIPAPEPEKSTVVHYLPTYTDQRGDSTYPTPDSVWLTVKAGTRTSKNALPALNKGACKWLFIDRELNLRYRRSDKDSQASASSGEE